MVIMDVHPELFILCTRDIDNKWEKLSVPELKLEMVLVMDEIEHCLAAVKELPKQSDFLELGTSNWRACSKCGDRFDPVSPAYVNIQRVIKDGMMDFVCVGCIEFEDTGTNTPKGCG